MDSRWANRSLRGISQAVALLTDWIASAPGLNFRLALVEMQLYPLDSSNDWPLLVVPEIVGRTVKVTRGVVKVQYEKEKPRVQVEYVEPDEPTVSKEKTTQDEFLRKVTEDLSPVYERWFEAGGRVSERQWLDVLGVIKVQGDSLDKEYLKHWSKELLVFELLQGAFRESGVVL